jgi:hypothetical protein
MMMALVLVGDDELPERPPEPTKSYEQAPRQRVGPLCLEAIDYCRNVLFQRWVAQEVGDTASEALAKAYILYTCCIESRKELDTSPEAKLAFVNLVRIPFIHWQQGLQGE